ncbi:hypothetical protein ACIOEX_17125 [Streptomyces sp. NPDC087850]|uniref:hypothetical protein n=1 Tax=Streptomyces sp. NPDC087850 TaxID=3365809 RepID=UPI0037FC554C
MPAGDWSVPDDEELPADTERRFALRAADDANGGAARAGRGRDPRGAAGSGGRERHRTAAVPVRLRPPYQHR